MGVPATDYVMEGGVPVQRVGHLSLPLPSPGREALTLLRKAGYESIYFGHFVTFVNNHP